ncbi:divergent polysaccharide deacetylase family protein, partial [bacterium]|nr:divergent polysaccharide deacetylase family protein [bacterium]
LLRLDLGVTGAATHTLVIHPAGTPEPKLRWGADPFGEDIADLLGPLDVPTLAVIVDDWGNAQNETTRGLLKLDVPLTLSILPGQPYSRHYALKATELALDAAVAPAKVGPAAAVARERRARGCPVTLSVAWRKGGEPPRRRREIMLHLPMEPQGYPEIDPGDRFVRVGMSRAEIEALVDEALAALPGITGVSNHMGSAATADPSTMERLMAVLRARDLFFLDSMTTSRSVAVETARRAGVPVLSSRLFLDQKERSREQVRSLLARLVRAARATGAAVGICHPYPETLAVLAEELPRYRNAGIRFVTASEMLALQRERRLAGGTGQ